MCVSLAAEALASAETAGTIQAAGSAFDALGNYAMGATRARMARLDADSAEAVGQTQAQRIRRAGRAAVAGSRADAVSAGVAATSGSALLAQAEIDRYAEQDALAAILSGQNQARGLRASADYYKAAGVNAAIGSLLEGGSAWARTRRAQAGTAPMGYFTGDSYVRRGQVDS